MYICVLKLVVRAIKYVFISVQIRARAVTVEDLEASRQASRDMHKALRTRKEALEAELRRKVDELRALCLKEGEITGEVPFEFPLSPGEPLPNVPRRVGTTFSLKHDFLHKDKETEVSATASPSYLCNSVSIATLHCGDIMLIWVQAHAACQPMNGT